MKKISEIFNSIPILEIQVMNLRKSKRKSNKKQPSENHRERGEILTRLKIEYKAVTISNINNLFKKGKNKKREKGKNQNMIE